MDIAQEILGKLIEQEDQEKEDLSIKYKRLHKYFRLCESPIEQIFLFSVLNFTPYRFANCYTGIDIAHNCPVIVCRPWDVEDFGDFNVKIISQHVIADDKYPGQKGHYRTDFTFEVLRDSSIKDKTDDGCFWIHRASEIFARLVVEVDGHEFHERTKEQAARDKSRDRYLTSNGYTIFRFTGSEVYRKPDQMAAETEKYIAEIMAKANHGKISPIDISESGTWMNVDFEMKRYLGRPYGRKRIDGI